MRDPSKGSGPILSSLAPNVVGMEMKLELVMVPVTDVDRAKEFYLRVGFVADHDRTVSEQVRFVQLTPPGVGVLDRHPRRAPPSAGCRATRAPSR